MDNYNLERFIKAQDENYDIALKEIQNAHKENHWIWFIFPTLSPLSTGEIGSYYSLKTIMEAKAYLENDLLKNHLIEICNALLNLPTNNILDIMDNHDSEKLKSCMTLFNYIDPKVTVFQDIIDKYFHKEKDHKTLMILKLMK